MSDRKFSKVSCAQARDTDMVEYLYQMGHEPQKIRGNNYWYLSPLRTEKTPSFKINRRLNRWFDFGDGSGGNLIDFGILYHQCSVAEFLERLAEGTVPSHQPFSFLHDLPDPVTEILEVAPLMDSSLADYLHRRGIDLALAQQYCHQVHYQIRGKKYYAIGFGNNAGGYELRNKYIKGASMPKDITTILSGAAELSVFEGFFDFLSFHQLRLQRTAQDYLILNTVYLFERALELFEKYEKVHLYRDNDQAGEKLMARARELGEKFIDESWLYQGHDDLNAYLQSTLNVTEFKT